MAAAKKAKAKRPKITIQPNSDIDRLVHEKLGQGFILRRTTDPENFDTSSLAWTRVRDGLTSNDPYALAFTVVINSVLTHCRIYFVLFKKDFELMVRHDIGLREFCSRRKRDQVKQVQYSKLRVRG